MPEGDTVHHVADVLRAVLADKPLVRIEAPRVAGRLPVAGTVVESVDAHGKHLLVGLGDGSVLRVHLRMSGSWHVYRPGERWRRPTRSARLVLEVADAVAVCFSAPVVELHRPRGSPGRGLGIEHLGPDLCAAEPDLDRALDRLDCDGDPGRRAADVLVDQRVASGVGNVYASEVLWACGVHPGTPVGSLDRRSRRRLFETAHVLLRANLGGGPRATVPGGLAVYGRAGRPCPRCGAPVRRARQGEQARSTYWCPVCQPEPGPAGS
ncbi:MAG: Fpg/Nei family DNA glycosylase [Acidimicrobiales bacterium]|nr:Fpg/Nei family DNA glycosylase [Acidimicrobiales bacterium]